MNDTSVEALDLPDPYPELTVADRCDKCGAQAYYRYLFTAGDLLFCQHHQKAYKVKIESTSGVAQISLGTTLD